MILGGYVKAIGAGLSCPDWPLCYGKLFPFFDDGDYPYSGWMIFTEWFHRLVASLVGLLLLFILYLASNLRKELPTLFNLLMILVILFGAQVLFGALTVTQELEPLIVVTHLGNAVLIIILEMIVAFIATIHTHSFIESFKE
jgi:cytochrome c oxidase assembly protein subunit 15